jgi:hypothetical protein
MIDAISVSPSLPQPDTSLGHDHHVNDGRNIHKTLKTGGFTCPIPPNPVIELVELKREIGDFLVKLVHILAVV